MNQFEFRLDAALRWRAAVAEARKAEAMACAQALADAESKVERLRAEHDEAARQLAAGVNGARLAACGAFLERSRRTIAQAAARAGQAREALKAATAKMRQADQDVRLLERLKERRFAEWKAESDREIEEFAAEAFLNRR